MVILGIWLFGYLVVWLFGYLVIWLFGYLVIWFCVLPLVLLLLLVSRWSVHTEYSLGSLVGWFTG